MTATELKWAERVREWKASGELAEDYARGRGFTASTLRWWSSRVRRGVMTAETSRSPRAASVRMARVVRSRASESDAPSMTIRIGAARVEVRRGFDRGLLREVVEALGGEP